MNRIHWTKLFSNKIHQRLIVQPKKTLLTIETEGAIFIEEDQMKLLSFFIQLPCMVISNRSQNKWE